MQPTLQELTLEAGGHPRQLTGVTVVRAMQQHRHLKPVAGPQGGVLIHIHHLQLRRRVESSQLLLQPLAEAAAGSTQQTQRQGPAHASGTGSQPQGLKGWQRSRRRSVSQPPRQAPWRLIASRP